MIKKRPHKHKVLTKALKEAKAKAQSGSFVYLIRLAYSLSFNNFNPPVVVVFPYISSNRNEDADTHAEALIESKGIWMWEDLEPVNYEFEPNEVQDFGCSLSEEAKKGKVAFCGFKAAK